MRGLPESLTFGAARADTGEVSQRPLHLLALAAFATLTPVAAIAFLGQDSVDFGGWAHVIGVAVGAAIATVAALALTIAGARSATDGRCSSAVPSR